MKKFGKVVVKLRIPILVLSFLLLIPSVIGYFNTRVNYDILYYLPNDIDTMQGQDILLDDFGKGAYAMVVVDGMNKSNVSKLVKKVEGVDHVASVISYSGVVGDDVPSEILPDKFRSYFENEDSGATLFAIFFDDTTSSDDTMKAIQEVRDVTDNQCYIAGMSAVVTDTKTMAEKETPFYVLVAVVLVCIVLAIFMDSFLVPVFFMLSIGMAIVYNLGSNYFLGEVSYITKALAAVLQLGVTLDYSIFLWHSYKEAKEETPDDHHEAMAVAIGNTLTSVVGSSITTVAGFIALCFMSFTLGLDLGVVMAKGVVYGDEVEHGKPEPDIFLRAAGFIGCEPSECVVIEDSINGIKAGHAAGMKVIHIPDTIEINDDIRSLTSVVCHSLSDVPDIIDTWNEGKVADIEGYYENAKINRVYVDRVHVKKAFAEYTAAYNADDPKIKLKIDHTYRVAALCERIAKAAGMCAYDVELAWLSGMLHDVGRFEQIKRYNTFSDADSVDHAKFSADLLFKDGLISTFLNGMVKCTGYKSGSV